MFSFRKSALRATINALKRTHVLEQRPAFLRVRSYSSDEKLKWSYSHGASALPLLGNTLGYYVEEAAEQCPDKTAVVFTEQGKRLTYAQLREQTRRLATGLLALGMKKGDRVGMWGPNMLEWILTSYGAAQAGIILVNINPAYKPSELKYACNKVGIKALVAAESFKDTNYYDLVHDVCPELDTCKPGQLNSKNVPDLRIVAVTGDNRYPGAFRFSDLLEAGDSSHVRQLEEIIPTLQFDEPVNIQFTSGTTGYPKAAVLSHHNVVNNAYFGGVQLNYHLEHNHSLCLVPPLYHCFGNITGGLSCLIHKQTIVFPCAGVKAEWALKSVQEERCTTMYGTPTMFIDILNHPDLDKYDVTSLSRGIMAGSPCPIEVLKRCMTKLNMTKMTVAYGMTENSPITFQGNMDDPLNKRTETIGQAAAHTEVKVVDSAGRLVPVNTRGELLTRGYCVMLGYWGDPEKTREVLQEDRWFQTGDIAVLDEDGYAAIVGRIKDCVIRGGENIYPSEVEQFLHKHEAVADVQVVGVPDARMGEELCAFVKVKQGAKLDEQAVKDFCKGEIAHFKIPRYVLFTDEFPLTATGKIQKFRLRDQAVKELGLQ